MAIAIYCFLFSLWLGSMLAVFYLGGLAKEVRLAKQASQIALGAAFWAAAEANGLKNATVIRTIIEKYTPFEKKDTEEISKRVKEMSEEAEDMILNGTHKEKKAEFNPDDLV